ncbi:Rpn family recombination-promoting nuclease/putative transposase [Clostridium sp.]|uniref:Rpn family recombination-promoting nuclease/putative transposase n=1 Tax=Clostridium sp. TaxID=1506 RepID=UPI00321730B8
MNNRDNKLVNILVDFAFKKVFAGDSKESNHILIDFLNSILELKGKDKILEIVYLNPFNDREYENDKQSIMDIKVKTEKGELIDIEVQVNDVDDYKKRSLYYWSKLYGDTINKGKSYYELKKSIVINILDFNLITENNKFHNVFVIKERDDNFTFIEDLQIHYIELNKFENKKDIDTLSDLEEWLTFFKECNSQGDLNIIRKLSNQKEEIGVAVEIMKKLSADEIEYEQYLAREKYLMDEMSKKKYAEYKMKEINDAYEEKTKELEVKDKELEVKEKAIEVKDKELKAATEKLQLAIKNLLSTGMAKEMIAQVLNVDMALVNELEGN